jgi:hypothetical protein
MLLTTANLTDNAIPIIAESPVDNGDFAGQVKLEISDRSNLWIWNDDTNTWVGIFGTITTNANPNGVITPSGIGQICVNTNGQTAYCAVGLNNNNWALIG